MSGPSDPSSPADERSPHGLPAREPLRAITSIKVKLGVLVLASVLVASVLATLASRGGVPTWLVIPVTVLIALGVTQLLAVGMTAPLREMTQAAQHMARGQYDVRVQATSSDEVGALASAFNRMSEDLEAVDAQRRQLIANVSHELRTPLAALSAQLENLEDGVVAPDAGSLGAVRAQVDRLTRLVADLLDLSRVEAGVAGLTIETFPLGELVAEAVAEAERLPRQVRYDVRLDPPGLRATGDRARLHQVLANLVENAARHGPADGTVTVTARRAAGELWVEVSDQGPGIAPADRSRIFERFGTGADPSTGGTGLGLAIARWVAQLHAGSLVVLEPDPGRSGARLRLSLPDDPEPPVRPDPTREETVMVPPSVPPSTTPPSVPPSTTPPLNPSPPPVAPPGSSGPLGPTPQPNASLTSSVFGTFWPERHRGPHRWVLLLCAVLGVFAALSVPAPEVGLALSVVALGGGVVAGWVSPFRFEPFTVMSGLVGAGLALIAVIRDADWLVALCVMAGIVVTTVALGGGRTVAGMVISVCSWPLAGLRGLPWLGRTLGAAGAGSRTTAVVRTAVLSLAALLVFGGLLASADPVLGHWASLVVPDLRPSVWLLRVFVFLFVGGVLMALAYLGLNPPRVEPEFGSPRPSRHRFEWLAPVLLVDAVFVLFLIAQAAAYFGGHAYVESATGLTYAEYVHQGFGQLTVATALTLLVVWAAARKARRESASDRWWLRGALGALCVLTLVVVASALHRMGLYQEAYGFTRMRVLVDLFELWLGLVVIGVLVAGFRLRGAWLTRFALLSGAALLLGLALANPDAWIARHNLDRYQVTGKVDWSYLQGLSADAVPTLAALPAEEAACALGQDAVVAPDTWSSWNLGRARARAALEGARTDVPPQCRVEDDLFGY